MIIKPESFAFRTLCAHYNQKSWTVNKILVTRHQHRFIFNNGEAKTFIYTEESELPRRWLRRRNRRKSACASKHAMITLK